MNPFLASKSGNPAANRIHASMSEASDQAHIEEPHATYDSSTSHALQELEQQEEQPAGYNWIQGHN